MSEDKLPIKFFATREVDELRVEGMGSDEIPKWVLTGEDLVERSIQLMSELDSFEQTISEKQARNSLVPLLLKATICDDATAKSRRNDISNLFQMKDKNNVIGLSEENELIICIDTVDEIKTISKRIKNCEQSKFAISCLQEFKKYKPYIVQEESKSNYKIKLVDFQDYEHNKALQKLFEKLIVSEEIDYKKTDYSNEVIIYNLKNIDSVVLDELGKNEVFEAIFSIEPMPKYFISLDSFEDDETIEIIYPEPAQNYATLGILDNGIEPIPQLAPWLVGERWTVYPEGSINPTHGTFVSGIALYGDICEGKSWVGNKGVRIFDAAIFPDERKEGIDEDELIQNIKEAISQNYEAVKVWNLSISITRPVRSNNFSDFAIALDFLQDNYNVLICKSAGNCNNFVDGGPRGKIHEGADSVRSLTVGSIAHEKSTYDLAEIDNPSPFSRLGPGPSYIIKPEVVHYGGNAGVSEDGKMQTTGVKSFSKDGALSSAVGTSFSTPRVAALAASIYQELDEEFDPLLIKSLIIHSASYSSNLKIPETERTKQIGFGKPQTVREIIYNSSNEATLILRDKLSKGEYFDILDFPMPDCLIKDGYYTGQIIATLVYDPILDQTQGAEYCQSNIDIKLGTFDSKIDKDTSKKNILNPIGRAGAQNIFLNTLYSKRRTKVDEFALKERLLIQYGDKYYPVKKYAIDLSDLTDANRRKYLGSDKKWYLNLKGIFRDNVIRTRDRTSELLSQEFCLIITIRDPSGKEAVYDKISQKLDEYHFWHSNIKISSDVEVSV